MKDPCKHLMLCGAAFVALINAGVSHAQERSDNAGAMSLTANKGAPGPRSAISLISASLHTCDLSRSIEFYTDVIGLRSPRRLDSPTQNKARLDFSAGGAGLLLIEDKERMNPCRIANRGRINVEVADIRGIVAQLGSKGGAIDVPVAESPQYRLFAAVALDPDGNEIEMIQRWK